MKNKLLLLILIAFTSISQGQTTLANKLKITGNTTDTEALYVNVQSVGGFVNTILKSDLVNVIEADSAAGLPITGVAGKLYITKDNNKIYTWNGTFYSEFVGAKGEKGDQGVAGIVGDKGDQGIQGFKGDTGLTGADGAMGVQGPQGIQGIQGETGLRGIQGETGPQGPIGFTGEKGADGTGVSIKGSFDNTSQLPASGADGDAYLINGNLHVWNGNAWINVGNIQGPQGLIGLTGATGSQGIQGVKGEKGDQGIQGIQGLKGDTGAKGDTGSFNGDLTADQVTETATRKFQTANQNTFNDATSSIQGQLNDKASKTGVGASGTWGINITGTAYNSNLWGGLDANFTGDVGPLNLLIGRESTTGTAASYTSTAVKSWLGLGSNAYNSTNYLPIDGAFSGDVNSSVNLAGKLYGSANSANPYGSFLSFGEGAYTTQLNSDPSKNGTTFIRVNGETGVGGWKQIWHDGNFNPNGKVDKVAGKSLIADSEITRLATVTNQDISGKENAFSKNTAFNKNFGEAAGTVAQGNDSRILAVSTHTHGLGRHNLNAPAFIDGLTSSNFRDILFGSSAISDNISTSRWNNVPSALSGLAQFGNMLAWSGNDTHAFIATNNNSPKVRVGGGLNNGINWSKDLAFSDGTGASGTWAINISGSAYNSTLWGGLDANFTGDVGPLNLLIGRESTTGTAASYTSTAVKSWLGLGSNAYNSTNYLPIDGAFSGDVNSSVNLAGKLYGSANSANPYGSFLSFGEGAYTTQLNSDPSKNGTTFIRVNGETGVGDWKQIWHDGNFNPNGKVDKVAGKSLIADSEITRLATVTNQDISGKFDKTGGLIDGPIGVNGRIAATPAVNSNELVTKGQLDAKADYILASIDSRTYKVYTALISQSGTTAPTQIILENSLGGIITWTKNGVGRYSGTLTGAFVSNKTVCFGTLNQSSKYSMSIGRFDDNTIRLYTDDTDNVLLNAAIEIRVYPSLE